MVDGIPSVGQPDSVAKLSASTISNGPGAVKDAQSTQSVFSGTVDSSKKPNETSGTMKPEDMIATQIASASKGELTTDQVKGKTDEEIKSLAEKYGVTLADKQEGGKLDTQG